MSERQEERLTSPPSEEEGLGEEVEPPFRVREDGWVFEKMVSEKMVFEKNDFLNLL